jgi:predicted aldo/keto reductase-like oxidoreductase
MKPFGGGLLTDANLAIRYISQFDSIVPDPGIEKVSEMEEIVRIMERAGKYTEADAEAVERSRKELGDRWCHRCDYCQPCPQDIGISTVLCVESFFRRMPYSRVKMMAGGRIADARSCTGCRACVAKCPYGLDIPELIKEKIAAWEIYDAENTKST